MWYSGSGVTRISQPSLRLEPISALHCSMLATRLRWVSIAPLATPVVPPVYCSTATSLASGLTSLIGWPWPLANTSLNLIALGKWYAGTIFFTYLMTLLISRRLSGGNRSATSVTITCLTAVLGTTFSARCAMLARQTRALAPESLNWRSEEHTSELQSLRHL